MRTCSPHPSGVAARSADRIFRSREAAQAFVEQDPFALEGLLKSYVIREWNDSLLA